MANKYVGNDMLNEVIRLTQGDLRKVTENRPIFQDGENGQKDETESNNEAFYKDYQGENHV